MSITRISRFVIGYMILAFGWWAFHLWERNEMIFEAEKKLLEYKFSRNNQGLNLTQLEGTAEYAKIQAVRRSGRRMIVAEGLFFTACLMFGLWVIRRSADREVSLARQRRNFLLSITHELKSPIASMRLGLETMRKHALNDDQRKGLLNNGLKDADRLQHLVEDLLLAARMEDRWQPLPEPVDLQAVSTEIVETIRNRFPHANIQVEAPPTWPSLVVDGPGIIAVIKNLLENAVKYSPEGAPVVYAVKAVNDRCQIQVADQGQGIPDAEKGRIFEKFYRIGNEDTRNHTGTGLGLFIVKQVVDAHKGSVKVADNKPKGTVFTVLI